MTVNPLDIDTMPRQSSTQLKNKWAELVRQVRQSGSIAITNHAKVEMVLVEAGQYREMTVQLDAKRRRDQAVLDELARRFDAELAVLQRPDLHDKIQAMFDADGTVKNRPRAGESF
jgi:prevent-host-death family protein